MCEEVWKKLHCDHCTNMNRYNNVIFGQKAFIIKGEKILIIKRKVADVFTGLWDIPGGKVESEDNLFEGIAREIKEEVNLKLTKILLTLSTSKFVGSLRDHPIIFRNIYLCSAEGEVKLSDEHSDFLWVEPEELINYQFPDDPDLQSVLARIPGIIKDMNKIINYSEIF